MKSINLAKRSKGFSMIELMVAMAIIGLLSAIAIPNFIAYRNKAYCTRAETDAASVARGISAYFGVPSHTNIPTLSDIKPNIILENSDVHISGDVNDTILITVADDSGRCPDSYQRAVDGWDAATNKFTAKIK